MPSTALGNGASSAVSSSSSVDSRLRYLQSHSKRMLAFLRSAAARFGAKPVSSSIGIGSQLPRPAVMAEACRTAFPLTAATAGAQPTPSRHWLPLEYRVTEKRTPGIEWDGTVSAAAGVARARLEASATAAAQARSQVGVLQAEWDQAMLWQEIQFLSGAARVAEVLEDAAASAPS